MKVIFLDIDGVLNVEVYITAFWDICKRMELTRPDAALLRKEVMRDEYGNLFCPLACSKLAWIINETDAKIVISSTWRSSGLSIMQEMWKHRGLAGEVIDVTPNAFRLPSLSFAERLERGTEIKTWLDSHPEVESYVIFDDDNDMLSEQLPYFIQTDEQYGITTKDAEKAIMILNGTKKEDM
jgi:hypothetical protein